MTESETIKLGKDLYENITSNANNIIPTKEYIEFVGKSIEALEKVQQFEAIGTIERFRELTEKAEPKKPINIRPNDTLSAIFDCPSCGRTQKIQYQGFHCKECGQRLDWE